METPRELKEFHNSIAGQWSEKGTEKTPDQQEEGEELKTRTPGKQGKFRRTKKGRLVSVKLPSTTFSVSVKLIPP